MKINELFKKSLWIDILRPTAVLFTIGVVIAAALAGTNMLTESRIERLSELQKQESMQILFPGAEFEQLSFNAAESSTGFEYNKALKNGVLEGYVFSNSANGYGGEGSVSVMTAVSADGKIKAVKILDVSNETPGLGQNAAKESFYSQFAGLSAETEIIINKSEASADKNEITPVTGATITSRAAKDAVNEALEQYKLIKDLEAESNEK